MCNSNWCTLYMASYTDEHTRVKGHKVTSTVTDPKLLSINICIPFQKYSPWHRHSLHTHHTDPLPISHTYPHTHNHPFTHTNTHPYIHPATPIYHTQHIHPPTHTSTSTQDILVSWGDCLCSCCVPVDSLSYSNPNTKILGHHLNCLL